MAIKSFSQTISTGSGASGRGTSGKFSKSVSVKSGLGKGVVAPFSRDISTGSTQKKSSPVKFQESQWERMQKKTWAATISRIKSALSWASDSRISKAIDKAAARESLDSNDGKILSIGWPAFFNPNGTRDGKRTDLDPINLFPESVQAAGRAARGNKGAMSSGGGRLSRRKDERV